MQGTVTITIEEFDKLRYAASRTFKAVLEETVAEALKEALKGYKVDSDEVAFDYKGVTIKTRQSNTKIFQIQSINTV